MKNLKLFSSLFALFCLLIIFLFSDFLINKNNLLVNIDQITGLGSRYVRDGFFLTQWDESRLSGMPTLDATFGDSYHPLVFLHSVMDPARAVGIKFIICIIFAFATGSLLFTYLSKDIKIGSLVGMLFALNPQFFTHVLGGHDGKMMAVCIMPLAIFGALKIIKEGKPIGFIALTTALIWMLLTAHLQMVYFFLWGLLFFSLFHSFINTNQAIIRVKLTRQGLVGISVLIALFIGAVQILPPYKYSTSNLSVRGGVERTSIGHAVSWSLHQEELLSIPLPMFSGVDKWTSGGVQRGDYFGHNPFKLNHDTSGMLLFFLAFLGFCSLTYRKEGLFWLSSLSIPLVYTMGAHTPFFEFLYNNIVGIKNFRAPAMASFWFSIALAIMATYALKEIKETKKIPTNRIIGYISFISILVVSRFFWVEVKETFAPVLVLFFVLITNAALWWQHAKCEFNFQKIILGLFSNPKIVPKSEYIFLNVPSVVLFFISLSGSKFLADPNYSQYFQPINLQTLSTSVSGIFGSLILAIIICIVAFLIKDGLTNKILLSIALIGLIDCLSINMQFIDTVPKSSYVQPNEPHMKWIKANQSSDSLNDYRIVTFPGTIDQNIMSLYNIRSAVGSHDNELATYREFRGDKSNQNLIYKLISGDKNSNPFLNLLNAKYLMYPTQNGISLAINDSAMDFLSLYYNVAKINDTEIIPQLKQGFDYRNTLILSADSTEKFNSPPQDLNLANGHAKIIEKSSPANFIANVETSSAGYLFISNSYHPYWKAYVNGQGTPVERAFFTLQAVKVPKGTSKVHMIYESDSVEIAKRFVYIGFLSFVFLTLVLYTKKMKF
jgi:hypothetical protein